MLINLFRKPLAWALAAVLLLLAAWWLYSALTANPKAEARLGRNQAAAAAQSGEDAVNTVGAAGDRDATTDALSRENSDAIRNAQGADAPLAAPVRDAGLQALCRRAAYARDPRCVRLRDGRADPR